MKKLLLPFTLLPAILLTVFANSLYASSGETIYAVTASNALIRFNSETPSTVIDSVAITGLQTSENIVGIDFRPSDNTLFAIGSSSRVYTLNLTTGAATVVGASAFTSTLTGTSFGVDFNPVADRIRIVSDQDQNIRVNPSTGDTTSTDTNLTYDAGDVNTGQDPNVVAVAYANNGAAPTVTTLFGIDSTLNTLVRQGSPNANPSSPNAGVLFTVGALGVDTTDLVGFDIAGSRSGRAFASLTGNDNISKLYSIDLAGGTATLIGTIGTSTTVKDISVLRGGSLDFSSTSYLADEDDGTATITVERSGSNIGAISVMAATSNGTAAATSDYTATSTTLNFADGEVSKSFNVPILEDTIGENNETVTLTLSALTGGADLSGSGTSVLTIGDNDQTSVAGNPIILTSVATTTGPRRFFSSRGVNLDVSCSEACILNATLSISNSTRRRAHLADEVIGESNATLSQAGRTELDVSVTNTAKTALKRLRFDYNVTLTVTATDATGNVTTEKRTIRVDN